MPRPSGPKPAAAARRACWSGSAISWREIADLDALLLTGVYGAGKSSVAVEIADLLELRGIGYALLDLDYFMWFDTGIEDGPNEHEMLLANLGPVLRNYREIGIRRYLLARTVAEAAERDSLAALLDMPLRVVRLTASLPEIQRRATSDVTAGRQSDLLESAAQLERSHGVGIEDVTIANDRPIREVAAEILAWLGWEDERRA